jgi:hypothetical protein
MKAFPSGAFAHRHPGRQTLEGAQAGLSWLTILRSTICRNSTLGARWTRFRPRHLHWTE